LIPSSGYTANVKDDIYNLIIFDERGDSIVITLYHTGKSKYLMNALHHSPLNVLDWLESSISGGYDGHEDQWLRAGAKHAVHLSCASHYDVAYFDLPGCSSLIHQILSFTCLDDPRVLAIGVNVRV
jgi:hypothetical protein